MGAEVRVKGMRSNMKTNPYNVPVNNMHVREAAWDLLREPLWDQVWVSVGVPVWQILMAEEGVW